eukprot:m.299452 g.299452  ORF g.299452 m.299452 type:complete len:481 (-) comp20112_c0_seq2:220-1662(-)
MDASGVNVFQGSNSVVPPEEDSSDHDDPEQKNHDDHLAKDHTSSATSHKPRDAIVSLLNGKQFSIHCEQGREISVEQLLPKTLKRMEIENIEVASEVFALWVVSSSLQLQLKPHHQPFKIVKRWPELLSLFAKNANPEAEVAMLYLKRRETVHQGMERDYKDPQIVELLFDEMTFNIVYSFYPCDLEDAVLLAAIHLRMECGRGATITKDDFLDCEGAQLPDHLTRKISQKKWRKAVMEACEHGQQFHSKIEYHMAYLKYGRHWPYYGAVFFYGYVEPDETKAVVLRERPDVLVRVGVNLDGIHVISEKTNEMMLSLGYDELQYNSYDGDSGASEPSFLIEYTDAGAAGADGQEHHYGQPVGTKKQLVVWTAQAGMIDALVSRYIESLSQWQDVLKERKLDRVASYRPTAVARGRKESTSGHGGRSAISKMFTLTKFRGSRKTRANDGQASEVGRVDATEMQTLGKGASGSDTTASPLRI